MPVICCQLLQPGETLDDMMEQAIECNLEFLKVRYCFACMSGRSPRSSVRRVIRFHSSRQLTPFHSSRRPSG